MTDVAAQVHAIEDDEMRENLVNLMQKFEQFEAVKGQGISYGDFKKLLTEEMGFEFEDEDQFNQICEDCDPHRTQFILFQSVYEKLFNTMEEAHEEQLDDMLADMEGQQGFDEEITCQKLQDLQTLYDRYKEPDGRLDIGRVR